MKRLNGYGRMADIGLRSAITAGSFGVVGAVFSLFFFADVPKVRTDIMQVGPLLLHSPLNLYCISNGTQKLPLVGDYFVREIPPSDNVSILRRCNLKDTRLTKCSHSEQSVLYLKPRPYIHACLQGHLRKQIATSRLAI